MNNLSEKNSNNKKGKNILDFFTFQKWAFIISVILLIVAVISVYPAYLEGKTAKENAQQSLEAFDNIAFKKETFTEQNTVEILEYQNTIEILKPQYDIDTSYTQRVDQEEINSNEIQQVTTKSVEKSEVEYTPIAKLQVEKIGLEISVLSEWSYELLEISVNKFSGPEPNESGNFIVVGHNYSNGEHFGKLDLLQAGDLIDLTDLSGRKITYEVYEILVIKPDEVEKLKTVDIRTLTLITCDTNRNLRLVVKSREISK